jgi:hypothetical protein
MGLSLGVSATRSVPGGLLGLVFLVVLGESFVSRHRLVFEDPTGLNWREATRAAESESSSSGILCLGDSMVLNGVAPAVLETSAGMRAYNLALGRGPVPASYFLLRRAIRAGARPRAVIVDFAPFGLSGAQVERQASHLWAQVLSPADCLELSWNERDASFFAAVMTHRYLPSSRNRDAIRANISTAFQGGSSQKGTAITFVKNWRANRGAMIHEITPQAQWTDDEMASLFYPKTWSCTASNKQYVDRFLRLAAKNRIAVFLLLPPFEPRIHAKRHEIGLEQAYSGFARSLQARFANLVVVDARRSGYDSSAHLDPIHLHRRGATSLSHDLGEIVSASLASTLNGPRWVELPAFRELPFDRTVQDLGDTRVALEHASKASRHKR